MFNDANKDNIRKYLHLFFIDINKLSSNNDIHAFEKREVGYTNAILKAYTYAFKQPLTDGLNPQIICGIQAQALSHIADCRLGSFKDSPNYFTAGIPELTLEGKIIKALNPNASQQGFDEFLSFWFVNKQLPFHYIHFKPINSFDQELFLYPFNQELEKGLTVVFQQRGLVGVRQSASNYLENKVEFNKLFASYLANPKFRCFINILNNDDLPFSGNQSSIEQLISKEMDAICNSYNIAIKDAETNPQKLRVIVQHIILINQLHPFDDGNCRTSYVLLNRLLDQNKLSLCLILDPNRLEMISLDEAVKLVEDGQRNYINLINNQKLSFKDDLHSTYWDIDKVPTELPAEQGLIDSFMAIMEANFRSFSDECASSSSIVEEKNDQLVSQFSFLSTLTPEEYNHELLVVKAKKLCGNHKGFITLLNAINDKNYSLALRKASAIVHLPLLKLLLEYKDKLKIDINATSSNGLNALDWVIKADPNKISTNNIEEASKLLIQSGACAGNEIICSSMEASPTN